MSFILISGSNGSGKSLFAERLVSQTSGKRYYIATMHAQTENNHARIEKHRRQREGLGFETLELPYELGSAPVGKDSVVLLEDVSNLLANAMFEKGGSVASVLEDICRLKDRCKLLIAVTISGLRDEGYDAETVSYINGLNQLNQRLFDLADAAYTMEYQQSVCVKGE
ncbi:MAG: bifunctional adenosylcobinamide kinase/adenosylcobinamide-phosphate guanylyltransferase [Oscillospiraceae bacterium]|nr:bifunctional adenosylcobinamide kinase/adenosylcobinamide-phosphate guanylyltransferase [Oscillospiraceae bacterium]